VHTIPPNPGHVTGTVYILSMSCAGYFSSGMGIMEALNYHRDCLEMTDDFTDAWLADSTKHPKYRTVEHWHSIWRLAHLGPRIGHGVISVPIIASQISNNACTWLLMIMPHNLYISAFSIYQ